MENRKETVEKVKELYRENDEEITDEKAEEATNNLVGLVNLLFEMSMTESRRKKRLKSEPDGFPVDGMYTCLVCKNGINENTGWYSCYGNTCFNCLKALKEKLIPKYILDDSNSYFTMYDLNSTFNIKTQLAKKYIKEEKLIPRIILDNEGKSYYYIFLKKENPALIKRYSPTRKSYDRHRNKKLKKWSRETEKKLIDDLRKNREKQRKQIVRDRYGREVVL